MLCTPAGSDSQSYEKIHPRGRTDDESGKAYVALQLLALFGVLGGQVISHLGEPDAVCFLTVLSLRPKREQL